MIKGLIALLATLIFGAAATVLFRTRGRSGSSLQGVGLLCLAIAALTHVCEAFGILSSAGWGEPRSVGHYIDLVAALLGATLVVAGLTYPKVADTVRTRRSVTALGYGAGIGVVGGLVGLGGADAGRDRSDAARRVVISVAALNLAYFGIEFAVALTIGSVSLFADSIDFLEDAFVNFLIWVALRWSPIRRARVGMGLAAILLAPAMAALWAAWSKVVSQVPPAPVPLTLTGLGALVVNLACALMLVRVREHAGSLTRAAFLSARNDVAANALIILAGFMTAYTRSIWPDLVVGLGIVVMNAGAAREVWHTAREEHRAACR